MTKKKVPGTEGFEEVMDMMDNQKRPSNFKKEGYAVYSFLEQEQKRLIAMDDLLSKKFINLKRYPQTEKLLIQETGKRNLIRDRLADQLAHVDSPFNYHLSQVFNSAFK